MSTERCVDGLCRSILQHWRAERVDSIQSDGDVRSSMEQWWLEVRPQAVNELHRRQDAPDLADQALERACTQWHEPRGKDVPALAPATPSLSFSLFASLDATRSVPSSRVTWSDTEPMSVAERLSWLEAVVYVEDLVADWSDIQAFLRLAWSDNDMTVRLVQWHAKWYHQTRLETNDYGLTIIPMDLMQNVMDAVDYHWAVAPTNACTTPVASLAHTVMDMVADGLNRIQPPLHPWPDATAARLWSWMGHASLQRVLMPHTVPSSVPWYVQWLAHSSVADLTTLMEGNRTVVPYLIHQAYELVHTRATCNDDTAPFQTTTYCLSVVGSILTVTRVAHFPWSTLHDSIGPSMRLWNDCSAAHNDTPVTMILILIQLYVECVEWSLSEPIATERCVPLEFWWDVVVLLVKGLCPTYGPLHKECGTSETDATATPRTDVVAALDLIAARIRDMSTIGTVNVSPRSLSDETIRFQHQCRRVLDECAAVSQQIAA